MVEEISKEVLLNEIEQHIEYQIIFLVELKGLARHHPHKKNLIKEEEDALERNLALRQRLIKIINKK